MERTGLFDEVGYELQAFDVYNDLFPLLLAFVRVGLEDTAEYLVCDDIKSLLEAMAADRQRSGGGSKYCPYHKTNKHDKS
eukprot:245028-Rhodomonas_salina.1